MKKKQKDLDHYITDALITSDEWDNINYQIGESLKMLDEINYDAQTKEWKKNGLAYGYLRHVEKLLIERGEILGIEDSWASEAIDALEKLTLKSDAMRVFLYTLRITTIANRAGVIPTMAQEGFKHLKEQARKAELPRLSKEEIKNREAFRSAYLKSKMQSKSNFAKIKAASYGLTVRTGREILKGIEKHPSKS